MDNDSLAKKGNVVETSGYGDIYPRGLVIGYIDDVSIESHGLSSYAVLTPAVELTKLKIGRASCRERVYVLV